MKRTHSCLTILLSVIIVWGMALPLFADEKVDLRLSQKVSYTPGFTRLHHIAEDLTKLTGVKIEAGKDSDDWRTRDLPLTVFVKGQKLGVILQSVADVTHCKLSCSADSGKKVYHFEPSEEFTKMTAFYWEKLRKDTCTADSKAWDTLVRYANKPIHDDQGWIADEAHALAQIIATLGPKAKQEVFAGKVIEIDVSNPKYSRFIKDLYAACLDEQNSNRAQLPMEPDQVPVDQLATCVLTIGRQTDIRAKRRGYNITSDLLIRGKIEEDHVVCDDMGPSLQAAANALSHREHAEILALSDELDRKYTKLPPFGDRASLKQSKFAILRKPVKIVSRQDPASFKERFDALNKVTGFSVICGDFISLENPESLFASEPGLIIRKGTVSDCLASELRWHMDAKNKLFLSDDPDCIRKRDLMLPEKILNHIDESGRSKNGIELDDCLLFGDFTDIDKFYDVQYTTSADVILSDLINSDGTVGQVMWSYYASLSPEQKAAAKSPEGLRLDNFDRTWFDYQCGFRSYLTYELIDASPYPGPIESPFAHMVHPTLRLTRRECADCGKHHYRLSLEEKPKGLDVQSVSVSTSSFPFP